MARKKRRYKGKSALRIAVEIIILALLTVPMFSLGTFTGIGYVLACFLVLYNRKIFRKKNMALYLIAGTLLVYIAGIIMIVLWENLENENWVTMAIMILIAAAIWWKGYRMRLGR